MSIVFTEQELVNLRELQNQAQAFGSFRAAVLRSMHNGEDTITISTLLQFLNQMSLDAQQKIKDIETFACQRADKKD